MIRIERTEDGDKSAVDGLGSKDRNNKATLLFTPPRQASKSSAKDLSPREVKLQYVHDHRRLQLRWREDLLRYKAEAYSHSTTTCGEDRPVPARILT